MQLKKRKELETMKEKIKRHYTVMELADLLNVSKEFIYKLVWAEQIKAVKIGKMWRIPEDEVEKLLKRGLYSKE